MSRETVEGIPLNFGAPVKSMRELIATAKPKPSLAQRALLCAAVGEELLPEEAAIFEAASGKPYTAKFRPTISAVCGRQSGKSSVIAAQIARYTLYNARALGVTQEHPAEILLVSNTIKNQTGRTFDALCRAIQADEDLPKPSRFAPSDYVLEFDSLGLRISVVPNSPRSVRGPVCILLICDEVDHWGEEKDVCNFSDVWEALEPAMLTFEHARCLKISSPGGPGSPLHADYEKRLTDDDVLFWQLGSEEMNPAVSKVRLFLARKGSKKFAREYLAQFEGGSDGLFSAELCAAASIDVAENIPPEIFEEIKEEHEEDERELQREFKGCLITPPPKVVLALDLGGIADPCAFAIAAGWRYRVEDSPKEISHCMLLHVEQQKPPVDIDSFVDHAFHVARLFGAQFVISDMVERRLVESYAARVHMTYRKQTTLGNAEEVTERYHLVLRMMADGARAEILNLPELHTQMTRLREFPDKGITTKGNQKDDMAVASIQALAESVTGEFPHVAFEPFVLQV